MRSVGTLPSQVGILDLQILGSADVDRLPGLMDLVSFVIPSYNPGPALRDAVMSVRSQAHRAVEIILVDDGTDTEDGRAALESVQDLVNRHIRQTNCGLPSARNAGFRAAEGKYVVPLDCDDVLDRQFASVCLAALAASPEAAFVYADCRVFGERNYIETYGEYNLYALLERNVLPYAALIRKEAWESVGGYDERMRWGCEDWEFWLSLGAAGRFGRHVPGALFGYRKHGPSLFDVARQHEGEIREYIRGKHPELYTYSSRARIKAAWEPAACVVGTAHPPAILDCETLPIAPPAEILRKSRAHTFAISSGAADSSAAECAALAIWGGNDCVLLPDGSLAVTREALARCRKVAELAAEGLTKKSRRSPANPRSLPAALVTIHRHLFNAGLLSSDAWLQHPVRSVLRLVPLRLKEEVNRRAGRPVFDLSFYLQFQPESVMLGTNLTVPLSYFPPLPSGRRRVALVTPHLGAGGAEAVLIEIARALDRTEFEIFLISTNAADGRWLRKWEETVDHVYDTAGLVPPERVPGALYSIARNWKFETILIQNSLPAYSVLRELKAELPEMRVMDLIHSVDERWDVVSATTGPAGFLDMRIVISEAARARLHQAGTPDANIRLVRSGIDLSRFAQPKSRPANGEGRILFAGRLDPVKRPLLLVDVAVALRKRRGRADFRMIVAGDGPEAGRLRGHAERSGIADRFEFLGHVPDIAPLLAEADVLVLPSRAEGIPVVVLEAFAACKPVVVSDAGAVSEVVDNTTGFIIARSPAEAEEFANALDALLDSPQLCERLGRRGRRKVESEYTLDGFRQAFRDLFEMRREGGDSTS